MSNGIEIDVTIRMGSTCENTMSLNEARALHRELSNMFNSELAIMNMQNTGSGEQEKYPQEPATPHEYNPAGEMPTPDSGRHKNVGDKPQPKKPTMPPPNLKVEAARERAAARTRGCGQR